MATPPRAHRCPNCGRDAGPGPDNRSYPFCSPACKLVDLGRWLDGRYRIAGPSGAEGEAADFMHPFDPNGGAPPEGEERQ